MLGCSDPRSTSARHCFAAENLDPSAAFPLAEGSVTGWDLPYQRYSVFLKASCLGPPTHLLSGHGVTQDLALSCVWGCPLLAPRVGTDGPGKQSLEVKARDLPERPRTVL